MRLVVFGALWLLISTGYAGAASIDSSPCGKEGCFFGGQVRLSLAGRIENGDLERLKREYSAAARFKCLNPDRPSVPVLDFEWEAWRKEHLNVPATMEKGCDGTVRDRLGEVNGTLTINSPGGDLTEAMAIGRWVRKNRIGVIVHGSCASSCIWVLASGVIRIIGPRWDVSHRDAPRLTDSTLQIHRPYLMNYRPGLDGALKKALQESKNYFQEMGVPPELAERMFSTQSWNAVTLTKRQVSCYRLNQNDMDFAEERAFLNAKVSGLTREEQNAMIRRRLNKLHEQYPHLDEYNCN